MEEQIKFIKDYLNGCKAIFNGKNLEYTDKALTILAEIETELKKFAKTKQTYENRTNNI
jgi:hypothetical protein